MSEHRREPSMPGDMDARAKDIFGQALDLSGSDRAAFLDRACGEDPALRARVETLLRAAEDPGVFLAEATLGPPSHGPGAVAEGPGSMVGPYKLLQLIGEGGFGSVFMAEQDRPVRRRVALKIIKLGMDTRAVVARFEQERQALALMDHPNIAKVLDAGATATGRPYFIMELVKGDPITTYCDKNNLSINQRLELFGQVCRAVQHAHTKGVIHRDLKPSNVLVSTQDGRPLARIIDFGIAKATDARLTEKTVFTEFRQLIGTPEYMSPEQADGSLDIDTRTDVYSLGVLLYELLTGSTPFEPIKLRSAAYGELQRIIREMEPPKPSTRLSQQSQSLAQVAARRSTEPARLGTMVRGELDWIVMKALDKDRARRYESASDLAADLNRFVSGQAVTAAPPSASYALRKLIRRHRGAVAAGAAIALALIAGIAGTTAAMLHARAQRDRALSAEAAATARAAELQKITTFQESQLKGIDPALMGVRLREDLLREAAALDPSEAGRANADRLDQLLGGVNFTNIALKRIDQNIIERAINAVNEQFKDEPAIRASLLQTLADTLRELGLPDRALGPQTDALSIRRQTLGPEDPLTVSSMLGLASVQQLLSARDAQRALVEEASAIAARALGPESPVTYQALVAMAQLQREDGKLEESEVLSRRAVEMSLKLNGPEAPATAGSMSDLAIVLGARGKLDESIDLQRKALEIRRRTQGPGHPETLTVMNNLAYALEEAGKLDEAEQLYRDCHAGARHAMGDDHPLTLVMLNNLAAVLGGRGKLTEAEATYRQAYDTRVRVLGPAHEDTLTSAGGLSIALMRLNRNAEAEPFARIKLDGRRRLLGPEHPRTLAAMSDLSSLLMLLDRLDEAEPLAREAYERSAKVLGPDDSDTLINAHNYAALLNKRGRNDEAERLLLDCFERLGRVVGPEHPRSLETLNALGKVRLDAGRAAEAETTLRQAVASRTTTLGPKHLKTLESRINLCDALVKLGRYQDAETEALAVVAIADAEPKGLARAAALARTTLVNLYTAWESAEPGQGHGAKAAPWRSKPAP